MAQALRIQDTPDPQHDEFIYGFKLPIYANLELHTLLTVVSSMDGFIALEKDDDNHLYIVRFSSDTALGFNATAKLNDEIHSRMFAARFPSK